MSDKTEVRISGEDIVRIVRVATIFVWIILGLNAAAAIYAIVRLLT